MVYANIATTSAGTAAHNSPRKAGDEIFRQASRTPRQAQYNCEATRIRRMVTRKDIGKSLVREGP